MDIEKLSHEGRGIGRDEAGRTVFVRGALPGEQVEIVIKKKHRQFDEAVASEILKASPARVTPRCEAFGRCGGCTLQHVAPETQILEKEAVLREKLHQQKLTPATWLPPLQDEVWGYRTKARLGVRFVRKKDATLVGFRELESNFLTDMHRCEVLHPSVGEHIDVLRDALNTLSNRESIAQIEVAVDAYQTALIFRHLTPFTPEDLATLEALHQQLGWVIFLQPGGLSTIHQVYPAEKIRLSYDIVMEKAKINIEFVPGDFTQVHAGLNQKMIEQALRLMNLQGTETVLDLFCGLGNFSLPIATQAAKVIAIEGDAGMVERARQNALRQNFTQVSFGVSNLFELKEKEPFDGIVDQLFLDPPRAGAEAVVREIERWQPKRIVYVSCDTSTLARDLAILVHEKGYRLSAIGVMDMFPQTAHVESMAVLDR